LTAIVAGYEVICRLGSALVVQGPMQATCLFNLTVELDGRSPSIFSFRGKSPLFEGRVATLNADRNGEGWLLWTANSSGSACMSAQAVW
jgi:3-methylfumaryl-CoA hydratase